MSPWFQILLENEKKIKRKYFEDNSNEQRQDKKSVDNSLSLFGIKNI